MKKQKKLIESTNMSARFIAQQLGVTAPTVTAWVHGRNGMKDSTYEQIKALKENVTDVVEKEVGKNFKITVKK